MRAVRIAALLSFVLALAGGGELASGQQYLADSSFDTSADSTALRANSSGQDWYESRQDSSPGPTLLTLDTGNVGGNSSKKARLASSTANPGGNVYLTQEFSSAQTGRFTAQWRIYVDSITDISGHPDCAGWMLIGDDSDSSSKGPNASDSERFVYMTFFKNGGGTSGSMDLMAMERATTTLTPIASNLSLDRWYTIRVDVDLTTDSYDVYVDNKPVMASWPSRKVKSSVTHISFAQWSDGAGTFYVDDVTAGPAQAPPTGDCKGPWPADVEVYPENPTPSDNITLTFSYTYPCNCPPYHLNTVTVQGNSIYARFSRIVCVVCNPPEVCYTASKDVGRLPAGCYDVYINDGGGMTAGIDENEDFTKIFTFCVEDECRVAAVAQPATNIQCASATLNGRITEDGGEACQYKFRLTEEGGASYQETSWTGSKRAGESFSRDMSDLKSGVKYCFAVKAKNSRCESAWSSELCFTTGLLRVETQAATALTCSTATLNGKVVDSGGAACQYKFRYKKEGSTTYTETAWTGSKTTGQTFNQAIAGLTWATKYYFAAKIKNAACESPWGAELSFTTLSLQVETQAATAVTCSLATLNGKVLDGGGAACQYKFRYREDGTTTYTETAWTGSKTTGQTFSQAVTGLSPTTKYYFAAKIKNAACESPWGTELSFTTVSSQVETQAATAIKCNGATLNGKVVADGGEACQYRFRYKKQGSSTYTETAWTGSKRTGETFSQTITGLEPWTRYYFAAQIKNSGCESAWGSELNFLTTLQVETRAATDIKCTTATLNGRIVDDGGAACQYKFRYKKDGSTTYTETSWTGSKRTGETFSQTISGLSMGTKYYFAAKAKNGTCETPWASELTFTTLKPPTVTAQAATAITARSATLNGKITDDGGGTCQYQFRYKPKGGSSYVTTPYAGSLRGANAAFNTAVSELTPSTTYVFAARAKNTGCEGVWSSELTFTTQTIVKPTVSTLPATNIDIKTAMLNGKMDNDGNDVCRYRWRYTKDGHTYKYTSWTGAARTGVGFGQTISELEQKTTYTFAAQGQNAAGDGPWGKDLTFTTLAAPTVTSISGTYFSATQDVMYLDGVSLTEEIAAKIDWNGLEPGTVRWQTPKKLYEDTCQAGQTEVTRSFDVGAEFGVGGKLKVTAVPKGPNTKQSETATANFTVIPLPPKIAKYNVKPGGGGGMMGRFRPKPWTLQYFSDHFELNPVKRAVDAMEVPDWLPIFGSYTTLIETNADVVAFVGGHGTASLSVWAWPGDKNRVRAGGKGLTLTNLKLSLTWAYKGGTWEPGGSFALGLLWWGSYKLAGVEIGPVEIGVELGSTIQLDGEIAVEGWGTDDPEWSGKIGLDLSLYVSAGFGVEIELGGGLRMLLKFPNQDPLKQFCVYVYGKVYVDYLLGESTIWEDDKHWCFIGKWNMSSPGPLRALASPSEWVSDDGTEPVIRLTPLREAPVRLMDRDYLAGDYAVWLPEASEDDVRSANSLTALSAEVEAEAGAGEEQVLQANVFKKSEPSIVTDNNELYLAWVYDDPKRSSGNRTQIVFSRSDSGTWTPPVPIHDDGTADFAPQLAALPNGQLLCAWENASKPLPDSADPTGKASLMEIAVASYDKLSGLWKAQPLTSNSHMDRTPRIATADGNTAMVVWISNEKNDAMGKDPTALNTIWYSVFNGSTWSEPRVAATGIGYLQNGTLAYNGTKAVYVYAVDADWDWIGTNGDQDLYALTYDGANWSRPVRLTNDSVADAGPQVVYDKGEPLLVWYRGDKLVSCRNLYTNDVQEIVQSTNVGATIFRLATSSSGHIALVWAGGSADSKDTDIFTASYNPTFGLWSNAYRLTSDEDVEKALSATYVGSDELALAYNKARIKTNEAGYTQIYQTDLCVLRHGSGRDLAVTATDLTFDPANPKPGDKVQITAVIHNLGDTPEVDVPVAFYLGDPGKGGAMIGDSQTIRGPIPAGGTATASVSWIIPKVNSPQLIYVVVFDPADPQTGVPERSTTNNMAFVSLMAPDLIVESVAVEKTGYKTRAITATIANTGVVAARNVAVAIHSDSLEGKVLKSFTIPAIDPNAFQSVRFDWDISEVDFNDPDVVLYVVADESQSITEADEDNNTSMCVVHVSKKGDITDDGSIDGADLSALTEHWLDTPSGEDWLPARDLDHNGRIDAVDLAILSKNWHWEAEWHAE